MSSVYSIHTLTLKYEFKKIILLKRFVLIQIKVLTTSDCGELST
jgi:hypothetical protein